MKLTPKPFCFNFYQPSAGHPDWKLLHEQAIAQAEEIADLIHKDADDSWADRLNDQKRKLSSLATALNNYRLNRKRWKEGIHALRPLYFIWTLLYRCNFRCTYCDDHRGNAYYELEDKHLNFEDRVKVLKLMRTGTSAIYFCGGEPTLDPDLPRFTEIAFNLGYHPLMINTNGYVLESALKKPEWRKWLRQMDIIIISLDGLSIPKLQQLWGIKKVEQVLVNLLMLRELRQVVDFKLVVNTVIGEDTVKDASDVLDFANDLGDIWFVPVPINYHGKKSKGAFAFKRDMINRSDYQELARKILERKKQGKLVIGSYHILEMLLEVQDYHCLPTLRPHVDPDGRIAWPCRAPKNVEPVYVNLLDYQNLDECWASANKLKSATNFHGPGPDQCGDMCAWMQNYTTGRYYEFLTNPFGAGAVSEIKEFAFQSAKR